MKNKWFKDFRSKFKVVIIHPDTLEEKGGFSMSRLNFWSSFIVYSLLIIAITTCIIFFTSIREIIPGYTDVTLDRRVYKMERKADSIDIVFHQNETYIENLKRIINDEEIDDNNMVVRSKTNIGVPALFVPMNGLVTNRFNKNNKHFGIDVVAKDDAVIRATADGTVVFSDWSVEGGYIIGIQHNKNLFSIYKHNASVMKSVGDRVKAGDAIAIVGGGGTTSTGPHMHFELWYKGNALNPEDYISFEGK